ncbi:MAG: NCS2 family permease [Deltaproteobacteria bacterium]|nr:MAG: NCS2 family permease [Deltaproteobacteria bacterium]
MAIARDFGSARRATPDAIRLRLRRSAGLLGLFPQHERIVLRTPVAFPARPCHGCGVLERLFQLTARGTTPGREVRGAVATFLTMAYILFANPAILAAAGMPKEPVVAATAAASALTSLMMGLGANFPIALAPGMGLNAVIAYQVAPAAGSWQTAMGLVVLDGLTMLVLVLIGFREALMRAIPRDLRRAIGVGIGLFIAFIGLVNARVVIVPAGTIQALAGGVKAALPPVTFGTLRVPETAIALAGLLLIAALLARRVKGAILIGIAFGTILALAAGVTSLPRGGWFSAPRFDTFARADLGGVFSLHMLPLFVAVLLVDFFDTIGTSTAIAEEAQLMDANGEIPRLGRLLAIDSVAAAVGGLFGASSVTSYIESAAGVAEGARTGLHSVVVAGLFLLAMFAAPIAGIVPAAATAPALIAVGFLMTQQISRIDLRALPTAIPAFVLLVTIPLTYSISHGIGFGFIAYVAIQLLLGRPREVHPLMYVATAGFAAYFLVS